jgi:hypothetical protein
MRIKSVLWVGSGLVIAMAVAYSVSCVSNSTVDTTCPTYCQTLASTCEGGSAQFPQPDTNAVCLRVCAVMEAGTPGIGGNNDIACRNLNISSATDEPDPTARYNDCVNGGITSAVCPDPCSSFCAIDMALCPSSLTGWDGSADCLSACAGWSHTFTGQLLGSTGDNLECRTYHLELSQTGQQADLSTHCPHTGRVSARCNDGGSTPTDAGTDAPSDATTD